MRRAEREAILKQGATRPETPRERRSLAGVAADLEGSPVTGKPLPLRLRNFRPSAEGYLASLGGPLPYMLRLREIERLTEALEQALADAHEELARACGDDEELFGRRWRAAVERWSFDEVNDLIERHNRWYPVESRLPMDPVTRDYALVNGRDYRRPRLGPDWALERFPARLRARARGSR